MIRKKKLVFLFLLTTLSMFYACGQKEADDAQVSGADTEEHIDPVDETELIQDVEDDPSVEADTETNSSEEVEAEAAPDSNVSDEAVPESLSEEERSIYEAYLNTEVSDEYCYTYVDYDLDGKQELYLQNGNYGRVYKYVYGGVTYLKYVEDISEEDINGLVWNEIENEDSADASEAEEMVHEGVYTFISQNSPREERSIWYVDEEAFLSQFGFEESVPFYEYALDGSTQLVLYYDEATGLGCGLRYYQRNPDEWETSGVYGFSFLGMDEGTYALDTLTERLSVDYTKFESCNGGTFSSDQETIEYDDVGRVSFYEADGIVDGEPDFLIRMYYEYDENGTLRQRRYYHNSRAYGSPSLHWYSYFDELGRLEYEDTFHTHGSIEYYYIYSGDSSKPTFGLMVDNNAMFGWIPSFVQF